MPGREGTFLPPPPLRRQVLSPLGSQSLASGSPPKGPGHWTGLDSEPVSPVIWPAGPSGRTQKTLALSPQFPTLDTPRACEGPGGGGWGLVCPSAGRVLPLLGEAGWDQGGGAPEGLALPDTMLLGKKLKAEEKTHFPPW